MQPRVSHNTVKSNVVKKATSNKKVTSTALKKATDDLNKALDAIQKKHGINLEVQNATVSKTGIVNIGVKGGAEGKKVNIVKSKSTTPVQRKPGQSQGELRFENHFKEVGLKKTDLHQTFKIGNRKFTLIGLKGRNNRVLLKPSRGDVTSLPCDQFLENAVRA